MVKYSLKGDNLIVPTEVESGGREATRECLLDQACPRDDEGEPEGDWLLPFDPRDLTAEEIGESVQTIDDLEILGFLRATEALGGRKTAREAIEARVDDLRSDDDGEA